MEEYIPNACMKINKAVPEKALNYYEIYPFERYGEPVITKLSRYVGIREGRLEYQECMSAAGEAYTYSICQCALRGYTYTEYYIRKMIRISVLCILVITNADRRMLQSYGFKEIRLNALERHDIWRKQ